MNKPLLKSMLLAVILALGAGARAQIYIETDMTTLFSSLTDYRKWTGSSGYVTWAAPKVTTNAGQEVAMCERYEGSCNSTGDVFYQTVSGLAVGTYKIELYGGAAFTFGRGFSSTAFTNGNGDKNDSYSEGDKIEENTGVTLYAETSEGSYGGEIPIYYATNFNGSGPATVTLSGVEVGSDGKVKIGMSKTSTSTNWHVIQLKGVTAQVNAVDAMENALNQARELDGKPMNADVQTALKNAMVDYSGFTTAEQFINAIDNLNKAVTDAKSSVEVYASAPEKLLAMKKLVESTNLYTEEALKNYYTDLADKYENRTLTNEEATALQNPFAVTSWHADISCDNFLLSVWDTNPDYVDAPYYINTWSVEGETDGSEFKVPFFEYWVSDANTLGARTLTATMENIPAGIYDVTAWVRVRIKKDASGPTGITMQLNKGTAVDVCKGAQVGNSQFYLDYFSATGEVGEDGILKIHFNVAEDNNICWLSFQNVVYSKLEANVSLSLSDVPESVKTGENPSVTINVKNNGTSELKNLAVWVNINNTKQDGSTVTIESLNVNEGKAVTVSLGEINFDALDVIPTTFNVKAETAVGSKSFFSEANTIAYESEVMNSMLAEQKYIITNVASNKSWGAGNNWSTRASLVEHPEYVKLWRYSKDTYRMESQVDNGNNSYWFNGDYMDNGNPANLIIKKQENPIAKLADDTPLYAYTIANANGGYYGYDGESTILGKDIDITTEEGLYNATWIIIPLNEAKTQLAEATMEEPLDATFLIEDHAFGRNNRNYGYWVKENVEIGGVDDNHCLEAYHTPFSISQTLADAPAGVYALTAQGFYSQNGEDNEHLPVFFANNETQIFPMKSGTEGSLNSVSQSFLAGLYTTEPIFVKVEEGEALVIGAKLEENEKLWCTLDNFVLKYYGKDADYDQLKNAVLFAQLNELREKAAQMLLAEEIEIETVSTALQSAYDESGNVTDADAAKVAIEKLSAAIDCGEASITAKNILPKMKELTESTNVYTEEAYKEYYGQWYQKYENGTLTTAEASGLQNPAIVTNWHASVTCDDFLLSAWDTNPDFENAAYYINTWSTEGENDGSEFKVPFFEYWTSNDNALGEKVLTATMEGLNAGIYKVTALVRVRIKNNVEDDATGITLQVNDGTAVSVCTGLQISDSQLFLGEFSAMGTVGEDGKLLIKFNVAEDNNISWLSFKNVNYVRLNDVLAGDANLDYNVTVSDAVLTTSFVLQRLTPTDKQFIAADLDKSGVIDIVDVMNIVDIVLQTDEEQIAAARSNEQEVNFLTLNGTEIGLVNTTAFSAFQMDVTLADGAQLNGAQLSTRANGLTLAYNRIGENTYRIVAYSLDRTLITQNDGTLLILNVDGNIANIGNVRFVDSLARGYSLGFGSQTTTIEGLSIDTTNSDLYTIDGRKVNSVRKGMNIVRQADGSVQKVLVK